MIAINDLAVNAEKTGMIVMGSGFIKHHISRATSHRGGADFSVFVTTGVESDGSDAGARPDQAVSQGHLKPDGLHSKVWSEASLVFPILVAETFARNFQQAKRTEF